MTALELLTIILGLITAALGLGTAYLNFRAAQKLVKTNEQAKRKLWPWSR